MTARQFHLNKDLFSKKLLTSAAGLESLCYSACSVILEMLGSLLFKVNASYIKMNPFKTTIILHMKLFSTGEPINLNKYILRFRNHRLSYTHN